MQGKLADLPMETARGAGAAAQEGQAASAQPAIHRPARLTAPQPDDYRLNGRMHETCFLDRMQAMWGGSPLSFHGECGVAA